MTTKGFHPLETRPKMNIPVPFWATSLVLRLNSLLRGTTNIHVPSEMYVLSAFRGDSVFGIDLSQSVRHSLKKEHPIYFSALGNFYNQQLKQISLLKSALAVTINFVSMPISKCLVHKLLTIVAALPMSRLFLHLPFSSTQMFFQLERR